MSEWVKGCAGAGWWVIMPAMTSPLTAYLIGGAGHGRSVDIPLEQFPQRLDFVVASGTVPYQRVGHTSEYRPATVLDKLAAPTAAPAAKKPAGKALPKQPAAKKPAVKAAFSEPG